MHIVFSWTRPTILLIRLISDLEECPTIWRKNDCPNVIKDIFYDLKHSIGISISWSDWIYFTCLLNQLMKMIVLQPKEDSIWVTPFVFVLSIIYFAYNQSQAWKKEGCRRSMANVKFSLSKMNGSTTNTRWGVPY